mgnify:CR=1 FL=1
MSEPRASVSNARRRLAGDGSAHGIAGIIGRMSERGLPSVDASPACPFVAFEDDRDERADRPDHRHRCYAEPDPAPRALAHQEAYCLSSAFPVCPVFQEWARRESARARAADETAAQPPASATVAPGGRADEWAEPPRHRADASDDDRDDDADGEGPIEARPRRNPPRDWAAPPPWASGAGGSGAAAGGAGPASPRTGSSAGPGAPAFLDDGTPREARGLAGSAADRLAGGRPGDVPSTGPDPDLASLVAGAGAAHRGSGPTPDERLAAERASARTAEDAVYARQTGDFPSPTRTGRRPAVSSTRSGPGPERDRPRAPQREHVQASDGPSWERARRNEAYPTEPIKDLEVVEGSRAYYIHKILTDAARPISYRELEEKFSKTPAGAKKSPNDKPHYSGLQALKMKGHCVIYKGHVTTPEILQRFKANVESGLHPDIDERPRFNSLWADEIAKYLKARNDWVSSKEVAEHLLTLPTFKHLKDTHVRTCTVLANLLHKRSLVEKRGQGKGAKWRLVQDANANTDAEKIQAPGTPGSEARH